MDGKSADGQMVRNSRVLGVFVEIVHGPEGTLRAVEVAGRGIAAEARCTLAAAGDKSEVSDGPVEDAIQESIGYADRLMRLGEIEDDLVELWRRRRSEGLDDVAFEEGLNGIVARLEVWP